MLNCTSRRVLLWSAVGILIVTAGCAATRSAAPAREPARSAAPLAMADADEGASPLFMGEPVSATFTDVRRLDNAGYVAGFSRTTRTPIWVAYRLHKVTMPMTEGRPDVDFAADDRTGFDETQLNHRSYTNSGYDRGHMAPSGGIGRCHGAGAQLGTFVVSNICPQHPGCNQRDWEAFERREVDYAEQFGAVWVVCGPIFEGPCVELLSDVRVPSAFFKVVVAVVDQQPTMLAIVMPNDRTDAAPIRDFVTTVDEIERRTGIDFFSGLEDEVENVVEAQSPAQAWNVDFVLTPTFPGTPRTIRTRECN